MTSTPFTIGLSGTGRSSSRILAPPGGGHTDIFGGDPEPPRGRRRICNPSSAPGMDALNSTNGSGQNGQANSEPSPSDPAPTLESPVEAVKNEPQQPQQPQQAAEEPPKRVRVPPGGFSTRLW